MIIGNKKNKVLVIGSDGMLGYEVVGKLLRYPGFSCVAGIDVQTGIDLSKPEPILEYLRTSNIKYDWCVNCVAFTNTNAAQNTAEGNEMSYKLNALAPKHLAEACVANGIKLIHISTDYVFSDKSCSAEAHELFEIDDEPYPTNVYGMHKLLGEKFVKEAFKKRSKDYAILRTSWIYGMHNNKSFIHKFLKNVAVCLKEGKQIEMTSNEASIPTSCIFLAQFITDVILEKKYGTLHAIPHTEKPVSRLEFAKEILKDFDDSTILGKKLSELEIVGVERDSYWPKKSAMKSSVSDKTTWQEDLKSFLRGYDKKILLNYANSCLQENQK